MFWIIIIIVVVVWAFNIEESEESKETKLEEEAWKMKDRMNMLEAKLIDLQKAKRKNDGNEI